MKGPGGDVRATVGDMSFTVDPGLYGLLEPSMQVGLHGVHARGVSTVAG
jgi:hypothetical protein